MDKKEEFLNRLRETFKVEATERMQVLTTSLMELEKTTNTARRKELIEILFREVHSLKGSARSVDFSSIELICQSLESVFHAIKDGSLDLTPALFDMLHNVNETIGNLIASSDSRTSDISEIVQSLNNWVAGDALMEHQEKKSGLIAPEKKEPPPLAEMQNSIQENRGTVAEITFNPAVDTDELPDQEGDSEPSKSSRMDTVRISTAKLNALFLQAEEMLSIKQTLDQRLTDLKEIGAELEQKEKGWNKILPEIHRIQKSSSSGNGRNGCEQTDFHPEELIKFHQDHSTRLKVLNQRLNKLRKSIEQNRNSFGRLIDDHLDDMKKALMLPFSSLLDIFPKLVRDLSRDLKKDVELVSSGEKIEIDRRILEEMKDPLIHLLRNCIDHGIEKPDERVRLGKPPCAVVTLSISHVTGNQIEILVSDDGAGIDLESVKTVVVKRGIVSKKEAMHISPQELLSMIFRSEVTTSPMITDLSGRGLGLAIAREKVEKLGGQITVESVLHTRTTFRILLPTTLSTFRGVLIQVSERMFVLPAVNVERVLEIAPKDILTVENKEMISLSGKAVCLVWLVDVLGLPRIEKPGKSVRSFPAAIVGHKNERAALVVDEVLHEQVMLVKQLGRQLKRVRNIEGVTILGSGKVVPILSVPDLMKSVQETAGISKHSFQAEEKQKKQKSILVVEDSITSRMLLQNILESAGYEVKTAVDGIDAFTSLRTDQFDLVVSDIEMPRMNGFDLTAKIRSDSNLSALPVVLVTSLSSREDREHGIDAGANAYIVKSNFDQSNLLGVIKKLI